MYKHGDIVLGDFPFVNRVGSKVRPALVISNITLNQVDEIFLLPITGTDFNDGLGFHIYKEGLDYPLAKPSYVRLNYILTLDKHLIIRKINKLNNVLLEQIIDSFSELIEII
jgi:mRNA interferase MazF